MIDSQDIAQPAHEKSPTPSTEVQATGVRGRILDLAHRLADLVEGKHSQVEDAELCHHLAHSNKRYVDRLLSLRRLLNPVDRIIDRREQIQGLQLKLAQDLAEAEDLSDSVSDVDPGLINQLQGEIAAVKKARKLYVSDQDEEEADSDEEPVPTGIAQGGLMAQPVAERMRMILGFPLHRHGQPGPGSGTPARRGASLHCVRKTRERLETPVRAPPTAPSCARQPGARLAQGVQRLRIAIPLCATTHIQ